MGGIAGDGSLDGARRWFGMAPDQGLVDLANHSAAKLALEVAVGGGGLSDDQEAGGVLI